MEVAYVTTKGQLVVPARLRRKYGIKPGTKVLFIERDGEIVFQPLTKDYVRSVCGMLHDSASVGQELLKERAREDQERETLFEKLGPR